MTNHPSSRRSRSAGYTLLAAVTAIIVTVGSWWLQLWLTGN